MNDSKLDSRALGLAAGTVWAAAVAVLALVSRTGWGAEWRELLAEVYLGYDESLTGVLVGAAWAFLDAFIGGIALGKAYNRFAN